MKTKKLYPDQLPKELTEIALESCELNSISKGITIRISSKLFDAKQLLQMCKEGYDFVLNNGKSEKDLGMVK